MMKGAQEPKTPACSSTAAGSGPDACTVLVTHGTPAIDAAAIVTGALVVKELFPTSTVGNNKRLRTDEDEEFDDFIRGAVNPVVDHAARMQGVETEVTATAVHEEADPRATRETGAAPKVSITPKVTACKIPTTPSPVTYVSAGNSGTTIPVRTHFDCHLRTFSREKPPRRLNPT